MEWGFDSPQTPQIMKHSEKLQAWFDEEKKKGLVDFKFSLYGNRSEMTVESIAEELNRAIHAPTVSDAELF